MKESSIEWLVNEITTKYDKSFIDFYGSEIQQAKELFKQQIIDAYIDGYSSEQHIANSEKYFNETFKTESNGTT